MKKLLFVLVALLGFDVSAASGIIEEPDTSREELGGRTYVHVALSPMDSRRLAALIATAVAEAGLDVEVEVDRNLNEFNDESGELNPILEINSAEKFPAESDEIESLYIYIAASSDKVLINIGEVRITGRADHPRQVGAAILAKIRPFIEELGLLDPIPQKG